MDSPNDDNSNSSRSESQDTKKSPPNSQRPQNRLRIIGTPDYIAPEIINGESTDNLGIDWWAVGCILYEFICGIAPFNDTSAELIFKNANSLNIEWPPIGYEEDGVEGMTPEAQDLI